ncbi:hypothetical protein [Vitreoscilla stercoraria]|uniref:Uncharacterized protein n=1 Tax=Vitreoscilla stercoraria TaxID=61 RepID=A0ABY4ED55_VITST|nr:hypothetical protein [Vitreoscilla stercoraria]UOO93154.1 hypothetical protein LVJ81_03735 [Vitreoscilla stercoraria]
MLQAIDFTVDRQFDGQRYAAFLVFSESDFFTSGERFLAFAVAISSVLIGTIMTVKLTVCGEIDICHIWPLLPSQLNDKYALDVGIC